MLLKKITACLLLVALLFCCSACGAQGDVALDISGAQVGTQVYLYYYDEVQAKAAEYGLSKDSTPTEYSEAAARLCAQYVAVNSRFLESGESLSALEKANVSAEANSLWRIYGKYYSQIGINKQTLTRIQTAKAYRDRLFFGLYDTGGTRAVKEATLQKYFTENYLVFQVINGYFTKPDESGVDVPMTEEEIEKVRNHFGTMLLRMQNGDTIEEVNDDHLETKYSSVAVTILKKGSLTYSEDFFKAVSKMKPGVPKIVQSEQDQYIFLVLKQAVDFKTGEAYLTNRSSCLRALKEAEFLEEIQREAETYKITKYDKVTEKLQKEL